MRKMIDNSMEDAVLDQNFSYEKELKMKKKNKSKINNALVETSFEINSDEKEVNEWTEKKKHKKSKHKKNKEHLQGDSYMQNASTESETSNLQIVSEPSFEVTDDDNNGEVTIKKKNKKHKHKKLRKNNENNFEKEIYNLSEESDKKIKKKNKKKRNDIEKEIISENSDLLLKENPYSKNVSTDIIENNNIKTKEQPIHREDHFMIDYESTGTNKNLLLANEIKKEDSSSDYTVLINFDKELSLSPKKIKRKKSKHSKFDNTDETFDLNNSNTNQSMKSYQEGSFECVSESSMSGFRLQSPSELSSFSDLKTTINESREISDKKCNESSSMNSTGIQETLEPNLNDNEENNELAVKKKNKHKNNQKLGKNKDGGCDKEKLVVDNKIYDFCGKSTETLKNKENGAQKNNELESVLENNKTNTKEQQIYAEDCVKTNNYLHSTSTYKGNTDLNEKANQINKKKRKHSDIESDQSLDIVNSKKKKKICKSDRKIVEEQGGNVKLGEDIKCVSFPYIKKKLSEESMKIADNYEEAIQNMRKIDVVVPMAVPPLHLIETKISGPPRHNIKKQMEEVCPNIKKKFFSNSEDATIKENFRKFCKVHDIAEDATPFINYKCLKTIVGKNDTVKFARFLAHGLPNRSLNAVYTRFQLLFHRGFKSGKFTTQENKIILEYLKHTSSSSPFVDLSKILKRHPNYIIKHLNVLDGGKHYLKKHHAVFKSGRAARQK